MACLAKTGLHMHPGYTKRCKNTKFWGCVFHILRFFLNFIKIMILDFWKYNGYNGVSIYFHNSEIMIFNDFFLNLKMWKTYPQNVVFLHVLVYRGYIWRPVLAKQAF